MNMVKISAKDLNAELTAEELKELIAAESGLSVFDGVTPTMTEEQLEQFKRANPERR